MNNMEQALIAPLSASMVWGHKSQLITHFVSVLNDENTMEKLAYNLIGISIDKLNGHSYSPLTILFSSQILFHCITIWTCVIRW